MITRAKLFSLFAMVVAVVATHSATAQQVQFRLGGFDNNSPAAESVEGLTGLLKVYIEEMQHVASLDQSQVRKLTLAGKTVAKKLFAQRDQMKGRVPNLLRGLRNKRQQEPAKDSLSDEDAEASKAKPDVDEEDEEEEDPFLMPVSVNQLMEQELWKKSVAAVLTPQQSQKLKEAAAARTKAIREAAVAYRVLQIAERLRLHTDQIQPMSEVVDRVEGEQLIKQLQALSPLRFSARNKGARISKEQVQDILTEAQMELFDESEEDSRGFGGVNKLMNQFLGVNPKAKKATLGVKLKSGGGGLVVDSVLPDSRAEEMGIQPDDVIDSVNDDPVDTAFQLSQAIKDAGDTFRITIIRNKKTLQLESK